MKTLCLLCAVFLWSQGVSLRASERGADGPPPQLDHMVFSLEARVKALEQRVREVEQVQRDVNAQQQEQPSSVKLTAGEAIAKALTTLQHKQREDAYKQFQAIVDNYSVAEHKGVPEYWMGVCAYMQQKYDVATGHLEGFTQAFPQSEKVYDAHLKLALCAYKREMFEAVKTRLGMLGALLARASDIGEQERKRLMQGMEVLKRSVEKQA